MNNSNNKRNEMLLRSYEYNAMKLFEITSSQQIDSTANGGDTLRRVKSREQSYVFFMLVRMVKYGKKFKDINETLKRMEAKEIYPIKSFLGKDYNGFKYSILTYIFNNKFLFFLLVKGKSFFKK